MEIIKSEQKCLRYCRDWIPEKNFVLGYGLTYAKCHLNRRESKLLLAIGSQLNYVDQENGLIVVKLSSLIKECGFKRELGKNREQVCFDVLKALGREGRSIQVAAGHGTYYAFQLVKKVIHYVKDGILEIHLGGWINEINNKGDRGFVPKSLHAFKQFVNKYASRLYNIMEAATAGNLKPKFTFDFFREHLGLTKAYEKNGNIMSRIIRPAIKEINEKTDLNVEFERLGMEGRRWTGLRFTVRNESQQEAKEFRDRLTTQVNLPYLEMFEEEHFAYFKHSGISVHQVFKHMKDFDVTVDDVVAGYVYLEGRDQSIKTDKHIYLAGMFKRGFRTRDLAGYGGNYKDRSLDINVDDMGIETAYWALAIAKLIRFNTPSPQVMTKYIDRVDRLEARIAKLKG